MRFAENEYITISPESGYLIDLASDECTRRCIWKISGKNMWGTPDDSYEWSFLNLNDNLGRHTLLGFRYGQYGIRVKHIFNKSDLTDWLIIPTIKIEGDVLKIYT